MIYTIGKRSIYERGLLEQGEAFKKLGAGVLRSTGEYYPGGSVWRTREDAEAYLAKHQPRLYGYAVYGVEAYWDTDTARREGDPIGMRRLMKSSQIKDITNGS